MKKTFKPLSSQNKTASTFRRKTIDPKIDLGIKKDEDGLENIDDYWRIAESILEADSVSEVESKPVETKPESKRFVINSLDSNVINDEIPSSVGFSMISIEDKGEEPVKTLLNVESSKIDVSTSQDIKFTELKKDEDKQLAEDDTTLYNIAEIKERLSHKTLGSNVETEASYPQISNTSGFEMTGETQAEEPTKPKVPEKKKMTKTKATAAVKKRKQLNKQESITKRVDRNIDTQNISRKNKIKSIGATTKQSNPLVSEPFLIDEDVQVGLSNASSFYTGKSELFPLFRTNTFETAILHLNPEAKIIDDVAYTDFTLYLKKGCLNVSIQGNEFVAKRDAVLCFDKGCEYSLVNSGKRLAEAIITYRVSRND